MLLDSEGDLAGLPESVRAAAAAAAVETAGTPASGRSSTRARAWSRSSPTPSAATCARRSGARSAAAATTATRTTTSRAIAEILKLRAERAQPARLSRRTRTGASEPAWPARPTRPWSSWTRCGSRRSRACARRVADMQALADRRRAGHHHRAVGLPLLRREGAQGEVRPRRERGEAVPAARQAARGDVLGGGRALRPALHAASPTFPSTTRTCASGR